MTFREYVIQERHKIVMGAITTAVGFFFALAGNSAVETLREQATYRTLLEASRTEASFNKAALEESFLKHYSDGVVLREFSLVTTSQNMANPLFLRHSSPDTIRSLGQYSRDLALANAYRAKAEVLRFKDVEAGVTSPWDAPLTAQWAENLKSCADSIARVAALR